MQMTKQSEGLPSNTVCLTSADKLQLLSFVKGCFDTLDTYGKTAGQLETISDMFILTLTGYSIEQIRGAFLQYMRSSNKMPTPFDIISIIEPPAPPAPPAWKPDWTYYNSLKERRAKGDLGKYTPEFTYMKKCEEWAQTNAKESEL